MQHTITFIYLLLILAVNMPTRHQAFAQHHIPEHDRKIVNKTITFQSISTGSYHTCAISTTKHVYCWGFNRNGQLGIGSTSDTSFPTSVMLPPRTTVNAISTGYSHSCALTNTGKIYCWGDNFSGKLGDGTTTNRTRPVAVKLPAGISFKSISIGYYHTCAISTTNKAYCWGYNSYGQLGDGSNSSRLTPTMSRMPTGVAFTSISAESSNTCAISSIGRAYCWGENEYGQLGDGTTTNRLIPTAVRMPTRVTFTSIITGSIHTCALSTVKKAYCWGWNGDTNSGGQLGDGTNINRLIPTAVRMPLNTSFAAVGVGNTHSCAISSTRNAYCWGNNYSGQLGNNTVDDRIIPSIVAMPARTSFTTIALGDGHTCSLTNTGKAYCWGSNSYGQLGAYTDNYDPYNPTRLCWSCSTKPIVVNTY